MKKLLILLIAILAFSSCKTKEERARRLIEKANSIFPIDSIIDEKKLIDTLIVFDTTIVTKVDSFAVKGDIQIVKGKIIPFKNKVLLDNLKARVLGSVDTLGNFTFRVLLKEQSINLSLKKRVKFVVVTKKHYIKPPPKIIKERGFLYISGIFLWVCIAFGIIIFITRIYGTGIFKR